MLSKMPATLCFKTRNYKTEHPKSMCYELEPKHEANLVALRKSRN